MPIDCPTHRDKLQKLQTYVPTASFIANSSWAPERTGHVLINRASQEEQIGIGVAKVMNHKLFCGPEGNCNAQFKEKSPLQKAKYTFTVCRPDEPAFHDDYDKMFSNLERVQTSISYGKDRRNMLDGVTKTIRFSTPVFEKREEPYPNVQKATQDSGCSESEVLVQVLPIQSRQPPKATEEHENTSPTSSPEEGTLSGNEDNQSTTYDDNVDDPNDTTALPDLEEETELWPISEEFVEDYKSIKATYRPMPLPIYHNEHFVEPTEANQTLKNALVEIHFGILHYKIGRAGENTYDSFTAEVKQVIVLKAAPVGSPSLYKRKNVRSGPVRPKKFEDVNTEIVSTSKN